MTNKFSIRSPKPLLFGWEWNWSFFTSYWAWRYDKFGTADLRVPNWGICYYFRLGWFTLYLFQPTTEAIYNIVENNWEVKNAN